MKLYSSTSASHGLSCTLDKRDNFQHDGKMDQYKIKPRLSSKMNNLFAS